MTPNYRGTCPRCGQDTTIYCIDEGLDLCEDCAMEDGWEQCDICGDFYPTYLVEFTLLDDRMICEYCIEGYQNDEEEDEEDE